MDCHSFFHNSNYREDDIQKQMDFEYLNGQNDAHRALMNQLFLELKTRMPHIRKVCDIGHGQGWLMQAARDYGVASYGFEINARCHEFARQTLGLDCHLGYFDMSHDQTYDLITAVMVFEHLEQPRELFKLMRAKLNPDGSIYICVPFVGRHEWPYLWSAGSNPGHAPPDPFYDNDVHITHFSQEGMKQMGLGLGARSAEFFISQDIYHRSPGAYQGVLFKF